MYWENKNRSGILENICLGLLCLLNPCPNPPARALTNVAASCDVSAVHSRLEVVIFVVDLKSSDAANKTGVKTKEAANILHFPHAANIERLVECYP